MASNDLEIGSAEADHYEKLKRKSVEGTSLRNDSVIGSSEADHYEKLKTKSVESISFRNDSVTGSTEADHYEKLKRKSAEGTSHQNVNGIGSTEAVHYEKLKRNNVESISFRNDSVIGSTEADHYEKLKRNNVESTCKTLQKDNDHVYETIASNAVHVNTKTYTKTCLNIKRIGLLFLVLLMAGVIVTVFNIVTRYDEVSSKNHESGNKTNKENVTTIASTTQPIMLTSRSQLSSRPHLTTPHVSNLLTDVSNGSWLPWSLWTACSSTCGDGIRRRYRSCYELLDCYGSYKEIQQCFESQCLVYGIWSLWSSWTRCDVTCGKGLQLRTRQCSKVNKTDQDCVGKSIYEQSCRFGVCPDCSLTCTTGVLNTECNMCSCNQTLSGQVVSAHHLHFFPLQDVQLLVSDVSGKVLTTTDDLGQYTLSNVCSDTVIVFSKQGFVNQFVMLDSTKTNIAMKKAVLPYITVEPQSKARIVGENVTLCCTGQGAPNITYYEWFKNSKALDEILYPYGSMIFLTNISKFDKGIYSCRANNDYGSIRSKEIYLDVQDSSVGFCEDAFEQSKMILPSECFQNDLNTSVLEVGHCNPKPCRVENNSHVENTCSDGHRNCCTVSDFRIFDIQCKGFTLPVFKVISCGCGLCQTKFNKIAGTVYIYPSMEIAKFYEVYLNGNFKTYTSSKGTFDILVDTNSLRAVLNVLNRFGHTTTKVIDLSEASTVANYMIIYVVDVTKRVQIDPGREHSVFIGKLSIEYNSSFVVLHIPKYAFANSLHQTQTGQVDLSISYLDSKNVTDFDVLPGRLAYVNDRGDFESIESFGSFQVTLYDTKTKEILSVVKQLSVYLSNTMNTWGNELFLYQLNTISGVYELMQNEKGILGFINSFSMSSWLTIGRPLSEKSKCFFSVRVFEHSSMLTEIKDNRYQFYLQTVHIGNGSSKTYSHTLSHSSFCFYTLCDHTKGYIEMWVSNSETRSEEFLIPANADSLVYLDQQKQKLLQYSVTNGTEHLEIFFTNTTDGPFFNSESACLASDKNHFKFYFSGFLENVFTFRLFFDVNMDNLDNMKQISQRVWYQKRAEGYRICFLKVNIIMQNSNSMKVRVVSVGGTHANITNVVLGIREALIFKSSASCIEYKCSGTIDEHMSSGEYDFTRVNIQTDISCFVKSFSQKLVNESLDLNTNYTGSQKFTFYAPTHYSPSYGIYSASTERGDIESAKAIAKGECRSGKSYDYTSDNPDIGVAVTLYCP